MSAGMKVMCSILESPVKNLKESPVRALNGNQIMPAVPGPTNEGKYVQVAFPWLFGFQPWVVGGSYSLDFLPLQNVPGYSGSALRLYLQDPCYQGYSQELVNSDGTVVFRAASLVDARDGIFTDDGSFDNRDTVGFDGDTYTGNVVISETEIRGQFMNGAYHSYKIYSPVNYADQVAAANAILAAFNFADTSTLYDGTHRFCYPSQGPGLGGLYSNAYTITWFLNRTVFTGAGPIKFGPPGSNGPISLSYSTGAAGYVPQARNGYINGCDIHAAGDTSDPLLFWILCSTYGFRTSVGMNIEQRILLDSGVRLFSNIPPDVAVIFSPTNPPSSTGGLPSEWVFTSTDVGDYGELSVF
jgi:hypothetical protein